MAIWDDPRRRIQQMEQEISTLRRQQAQMRQQIQQNGTERIRRLEQQYQEQFQRHARETEAAYAQRLQHMQTQLLQAYNAQLRDLQEFDEQCHRKREMQLAELHKANEDLRQQLHNIQERGENTERGQRNEADQLIEQARQTVQKAQQTNHQFFCPDQLAVIQRQLTRSVEMYGRGMYSVAAASALSAMTEMELLILTVHQKEEEWLQLFNSYVAIVSRVAGQLQSMQEEHYETLWTRREERPGHDLTEASRNFWSSGQYESLGRQITLMSEQIRHAQQVGIHAFLREGGAQRAAQLVTAIRDARVVEDHLAAVITSIRNELTFSDERYVFGQLLADTLYHHDYQILQEGFQLGEDGREQPMESYEVKAALSDGVQLDVTIAPCRENGVVMYNRFFVTATLPNLRDLLSIQEMTQTWQQRFTTLLMTAGCDATQLIVRSNSAEIAPLLDDLASRRPDPMEYAKKLALKYH